MVCVAMETGTAEEHPPLEVCLRDLRNCDVYIGLFAYRYGFVPAGETQSITELEYRAAGESDIDRLIFIADTKSWDLEFIDGYTGDGRNGTLIRQLRDELCSTRTVAHFSTPTDLAQKVTLALHEWTPRGRNDVRQPPHRRDARLQAYLDDCIRRDAAHEVERHYVRVSGTAADPVLPPTQFPIHLIQRSVRVLAEAEVRRGDGAKTSDLPSITDALERYPQVALVGDPGSGKSTTLRYLQITQARLASNGQGHIPLFVNLAEWPASVPDLKTLLVHERNVRGCPVLPPSEFILLLDGLNELGEQHYASRVESIQNWIDENPAARVVVTSRQQQYAQGKQLAIPTVTIHPLTDSQIEEFVGRYLTPADAAGLLSSMGWESRARGGSRHLSRLAQNPFQLVLMCWVFAQQRSLPDTRGELLRRLTEWSYERERESARHCGLSSDEMVAGLGRLAFRAVQVRSATAIEETWAAKQMPDHLDYERVRALGENMGLLRRTKKERYVQFAHQLVLEYFAAEHLRARPQRLERILRKPQFKGGARRSQRADEVCFTFIDLSEPTSALTAVSRIDPFLAVDAMQDSDRLAAIDEATRAQLGRDLLRVRDSDRYGVIERLQFLGEAATGPLGELVATSEKKPDRRFAVESLGAIETSGAIRQLAAALQDKDRWVRRDAGAAMRRLADRRPDLAAAFLANELSHYGTNDRNHLVSLLAPTSDDGPTSERPGDEPFLSIRIEEEVQEILAVSSLVEAKTAAARERDERRKEWPPHDVEPPVGVAPAANLDVHDLLRQLAAAPPMTSDPIVFALVSLGNDAVPDLIDALTGAETELRRRIPRVLAHLRDRRTIEPLKALIDDGNEDVAFHALRALGNQDDPTLLPLFAKYASSWNPRVKDAAMRALLNHGEAGLEIAVQHLRDSSTAIQSEVKRRRLMRSLAAEPAAITVQLRDPNIQTRHLALGWLLKANAARAVAELRVMLRDRESATRLFAVRYFVKVVAQAFGYTALVAKPPMQDADVPAVRRTLESESVDLGRQFVAVFRQASPDSELRQKSALVLHLLFVRQPDLLYAALGAPKRERVAAPSLPATAPPAAVTSSP